MTIDSPESIKPSRKVKSIAIIGGGASGAIALDTLVKENEFDEIVLYERRSVLGGVWVLDPKPDDLPLSTGYNPDLLDPKSQIPLDLETTSSVLTKPITRERFIKTPAYEKLRTNVPEQLMTYSDLKTWNAPDELRVDDNYVRRKVVQNYIETYLKRHHQHIVYDTTLENVEKDYSKKDSQFILTLQTKLSDDKIRWFKKSFDAIIVATGHYNIPYIPKIEGIDQVLEKFPGKILHSKTFRLGDKFTDETVIVVGSRVSGLDITGLLAKTSKQVYQSKRTPSKSVSVLEQKPNVHVKPIITKYEIDPSENVIVHFEDGSKLINPDHVIYATGYQISYPFIKDLFPNFTNGVIANDLYHHTFYTKDPLFTIIGLPVDAITFRAFELQAIWISRFFSGKVPLPPLTKQNQWLLQRFGKYGNSRSYHLIAIEDKFKWPKEIYELAGGVKHIGEYGKDFPTYTKQDEDLFQSVLDLWAEETYGAFFTDFDKDTYE